MGELIFLLLVVVHAYLAYGVWIDAIGLETTRFAPPVIWGLTVLVSGVLGVLVYWLIHSSSLGPAIAPREDRMRERVERAANEEGAKNDEEETKKPPEESHDEDPLEGGRES